jgi:hypothetical protein
VAKRNLAHPNIWCPAENSHFSYFDGSGNSHPYPHPSSTYVLDIQVRKETSTMKELKKLDSKRLWKEERIRKETSTMKELKKLDSKRLWKKKLDSKRLWKEERRRKELEWWSGRG